MPQMTTKRTGAKALYQAIADAETTFGEFSPEAAYKLFDLMDYFESVDDREGTMHCMNWLQRIIQERPQNAKTIAALTLAATHKISQSKRRRLRGKTIRN